MVMTSVTDMNGYRPGNGIRILVEKRVNPVEEGEQTG